ncbi:hypothetical protein ABB37_01903 [Leptomonas pyrrhocoris]|uniref:Uncharacterized protein n=1 Tax=Leptomonas pyrrhocoris TaxID=157538 RepID=A0A0N0DY19_LEPPY|nr:hypothetical protein ABB37_01903 [Leptomonas pyrrhocoris]KPA83635.1 hypothetical protein ABB37_01903 [Leptomonas pyrrhocoris]|eukprot:XP_015662074.1 hypothetical protein ABB37_01903 [Leptomonas pyrrhocoris]
MIPALNMTKIHRSPPANTFSGGGSGGGGGGGVVGQGNVSRLHMSRQMSPRTPNVTSPSDATSSQPSAHLTRRAAEVTPVLEMNPLQCQNVSELQRKLIDTAEWVMKLRYYYAAQLQERDQWLEARLRHFEKFYADAVNAAAEARVASTTPTTASANGSPVDNGAPATISTSKMAGFSGVPHRSVSEARATESEKDSTTPAPRRPSKQQENTTQFSAVSSPQPSLPNNAHADTAGVAVVEDINSSAARTRTSQPKKSAVVRIPRGRRTVSVGSVRRQQWPLDGANSSHLSGVVLLAVDRGESRPTRAARSTAETDINNTSSGSAITDGTGGVAHYRGPPELAAVRGTPSSNLVVEADGPRLDVLAATAPTTMRPGKSALPDTLSSNHVSFSGREADRRKAESSTSRRRCYSSSPRAMTTDMSATAPPHSQYLEAGFGLRRDVHLSSTAPTSRENNGLHTSVGSPEPAQSRTPREGGSSLFHLFGSGRSRPGRVYSTSRPSQASRRTASRGLSGRVKQRSTSSTSVSLQSSPARTHTL